jgi:hypothetical protein
MFKVSKDHVNLIIELKDDVVKVKPDSGYPFLDRPINAIASSEMILARHFLKECKDFNKEDKLKKYFEQRGYKINP